MFRLPFSLSRPATFWRVAPVLIPLLAAPLRATAPDEAWVLAHRFDFNGALHVLDTEGADATQAPADLRLARAAALLGSQPRTTATIAAALDATRTLSAAPSVPADTRFAAKYLEARILREHLEPRTPENLAAARALFRELVDSGSDHPLAVRATVSLAFSLLYDDPSLPRQERLAAVEALLPRATRIHAVERDLRYVIANAVLVWGLDPKIARDHLRRVEQIGFSQLPRRLNVRILLARLAEQTGDLDLAEHAYHAFLAEAVRDNREITARENLAAIARRRALPATPPAAPSAG